jgi:hypothetical protein
LTWSRESHFIWEYDGRGRRISEINFGRKSHIVQVTCLVQPQQSDGDNRETVVVAVQTGEIKVMEKGKDSKWTCKNELQVSTLRSS